MLYVVCIVFSCVAANHLGLIDKIEEIIGCKLPIINCVKCFTFWSVLLYLVVERWNVIEALALSFTMAYVAIWVELFMGFIDTIYNTLYGKIFKQ